MAVRLDDDILTRRRQILGDDHPDTLDSANNLAIDLRGLDQPERSRSLDEDTLSRSRRVLGDDHPATLDSAHNLAVDLRELSKYEQARRLDEDTLSRRRRVLGDDHRSSGLTNRTGGGIRSVTWDPRRLDHRGRPPWRAEASGDHS